MKSPLVQDDDARLRREHAFGRHISSNSAAIYNFHTRKLEIVPPKYLEILSFCRVYQTRGEIKAHLAGEGVANETDAGSILADLEQRQLLLPESGLARALASPDSPDTRLSLSAVGITTRERPALLERSLNALAANTRARSRPLRVDVIEDSRCETAAAENRLRLTRLASSAAAVIRYASRADRQLFAERLSKLAGVEPATTEFGLLGDKSPAINTGAGRNCLLLANAGNAFLHADDDLSWRVARPPELHSGLALSSSRDPTHFWFYAGPEETESSADWVECDFLGLHEQLLGRSVAGCVAGLRGEEALHLDGLDVETGWRLRKWGGRVAATSSGIIGDSGTGGSAYLFLEPESHGRLIQSEKKYRQYVQSRQVQRCVARRTISSGDFCMGGNLALDHRFPLPPFLPVDRNSDGLFGALLRHCFPESYFGFLPGPVQHKPEPGRTDTFERIWAQQRRITSNHVVMALFDLWRRRLEPPLAGYAALQRLGTFFRECGGMRSEDLEELLRLHFLELFAEQQKLIEISTYDEEACPPFFAKYLRRYVEEKRKGILAEHYAVPADLRETLGLEEARASIKRILQRFGELLCAWQRIVEAAQELSRQGRGMTVDLAERRIRARVLPPRNRRR
jgi:hypothetical protein